MKQFSSQFKKQSESIRMRASEKRELAQKLQSYMEYHPLPASLRGVQSEKKGLGSISQGILSEPFFAVSIPTAYFRSFAGVFAVVCVLVVPLVAERSLPGDVLYPVKVQFNEELRSSLSFTPYAKVAWETQRVERRIAEARLMALEGTLTQEAQADFSEAIKVHTDAAQREIALLRETNSDDAAIAELTFASALAVQSEVLEEVPNQNGADTTLLAVADVVAEARSSVAQSQTQALVSYEGLLAAVELESTHAFELLDSVRDEASTDEIASAERLLADVGRKIAEAKAHYEGSSLPQDTDVATVIAQLSANEVAVSEADLFATSASSDSSEGDEATLAFSLSAEQPASDTSVLAKSSIVETVTVPTQTKEELQVLAHELLKTALSDIQKIGSYLTNIDVRENVPLSELVPVTPTAGEKALEVKAIYESVKQILADIEQKEIPTKYRNKIRYGTQEAQEQLAKGTAALTTGDLDGAKGHMNEAYSFAVDMKAMLTDDLPSSAEVPAVTPTEVTEVGVSQ